MRHKTGGDPVELGRENAGVAYKPRGVVISTGTARACMRLDAL